MCIIDRNSLGFLKGDFNFSPVILIYPDLSNIRQIGEVVFFESGQNSTKIPTRIIDDVTSCPLAYLCRLGLILWNLSCLEFNFDNIRFFYWHKNKIGRNDFFLLLPDFANFLPCWLAQFCWDSQQGRELAKSGSNKKKINNANLILMSIGKSGSIKFEFQTT